MREYEEVVRALMHCAHSGCCEGCPLEGKALVSMGSCEDAIKHKAAEIIGELTAWRDPVNDPPEVFLPVLVCRVKDPGKPPVVEQGCKEVGGWWKVYGTRVKKIVGWRPMPKGLEVGA